MKRVAGLVLAIACASCRCTQQQLEPIPEFVRVDPSELDFGRVFVGSVAVRGVEVLNAGKAPIDGTWSLTGDAFLADDAVPARAVIGSTFMSIRCAPPGPGVFDGELKIALAGFEPVRVPLSCEGVAVPECVPSAICRASAWDATATRCVERDAADGTGCAGGDVCLLDAQCRSGRCEGRVRGCDDGDPCTSDSCHPVRGCEHAAVQRCPGEGPCRVGQCTPGVGCALADAPDGTPCGPQRTCTLADVCIAGACVQRDPPDGFQCAPEGPCGGAGRCENDVCVTSGATTLQPAWTFGAPQPDGGPPEAWSDLYAHRDGGLTLGSYFMTPPRLSANGATPVQLTQSARRCIEWLGWDVCGDLPALQSSPIAALDPATGQTLWSYGNGAVDVPAFTGAGVQFFTARLAVLNESELLVLYESRTLSAEGVDPRCRAFGLVVLDRRGQHLRSLFINDPIFATCNHPHSYGVAVDAQSNIYLAFTPSSADNPAISLTGTTIFSFSPALQLRWRRFVGTLGGGELAVAEGLLFHEKSAEVFSTQNGAVVTTLAQPFGLGVVGDGTAVGSVPDGSSLSGLSTSSATARWSRALQGQLGRAPLAIAAWQSPWGPRNVALAFTQDLSGIRLEATEVLTGALAFSCPAAIPELPLMTSVTPGGVALMLGGNPLGPGWQRCDDCDPKYARTRSQFAWLPLPGVAPSEAPWSAGWGNPGHSHHEGR